MCAVEHDECKSGEDVLWALPRLRLRADPGLIIFHFPIAFNSAARVCVCVCVHVCATMWHVRVHATHGSFETLYTRLGWYLLLDLCNKKIKNVKFFQKVCFLQRFIATFLIGVTAGLLYCALIVNFKKEIQQFYVFSSKKDKKKKTRALSLQISTQRLG